MLLRASLTLSALAIAAPAGAASYYTLRLEDAKAVYLTRDHFTVTADGVADDSDAIQQAIDKVQTITRQGVLFIPDGK
jgi:hypothetical protein